MSNPPPNWPPPPGPMPYDQAQRMYFSAGSYAMRHRTLLSEVMGWSWEEQDALVQIAASSIEPLTFRTRAIHLISGCQLTRHVPVLIGLLEDPDTDSTVRNVAAGAVAMLAGKESLPLLYRLATDPLDPDPLSLSWACVKAVCTMVIRFQFVDTRKYKTGNFDESCRRFWEDVQPTEQMILAWSRGEKTG